MKPVVQQTAKSVAAAIAGGVIGYFGFFLAASYGFYAMVLPGGMIGIGASMFPVRKPFVPVLCGAAAVALSVFTEWKFAPFIADDSLNYFVKHVHLLSPFKLFMMGLGTFLAFYLPFRHRHGPGSA
jgi:hypothetical protein